MMTQPSIYLFTKKHYSITYVSSDAPRPAMDDLSKATAAELRSVFVDSFIANAGTYEMKDGKLTTRPTVAKSPGFMQDGNFVTMSVKINGKGLVASPNSSIDCGRTCSATVAPNTEVSLTATPEPGFFFVNWTGACSGTAATCTVRVTGSTSVQANFKK